jgi:hypothetical protein
LSPFSINILAIRFLVPFCSNFVVCVTAAAPESVVYFICLHYVLRKACEAWALWTVSPSVLKGYFTNMWTLVDTTAIVLTLVATALHQKSPNEYLNGLNAFVVGLLWIKVLGFLKVVNRQMSTFIVALSQILYDIRLFMVVLLVCISMFGDMFHIAVSTKDDGEFCANEEQESGTLQDFCENSWASTMRTYVSPSIMLILGWMESTQNNCNLTPARLSGHSPGRF